MRVLIVDNYDSFTYNIEHYISSIAGCRTVVVKNDSLCLDGIDAIDPDCLILSPGPGHPGVARDFGICAELLAASERPILGICLGHQGLALHFGASVGRAPVPVHGRTSAIFHDGSRLFEGIPQGFQAVRYHSLLADPSHCAELRLIARTQDGLPMGVQHRDRPIWGVQFHPESICTEHGMRLLENFVTIATELRGTARTPDEAPEATLPRTRPADCAYVLRQRRLETPRCPEDVFVGLYADEEHAFWLDSSRVEPGLSRFSFIGAPGGAQGMIVRYWSANCRLEVDAQGRRATYSCSIFSFLEQELAKRRCDGAELPFDFNCGFVGYFGYELKQECGARDAHEAETPDAAWILADRLIAFDHERGETTLVALTPAGDTAEAERWLDETEARIGSLPPAAPVQPEPTQKITRFRLDRGRAQYLSDIDTCMEAIHAGESYEICLTNHLATAPLADPLSVYRVLRRRNPAPYASYMRFGGVAILCSSPERFLKIDRSSEVTSKPIKGTAARHADPARDAAAVAALATSIKDRAENLMIVDLLRNDLSRVCEAKSVGVPKLMEVESYATVHQLVSTIRGRLKPECGAIDCVGACFPGGSMTGAPKLRTMEIIDTLEGHARGIYSGALGFLALSGAADLNIVIRTAVATPERTTIGLGGAIVALSDAVDEFDEIVLKGQALMESITEATGARDYEIDVDAPIEAAARRTIGE